MARSTPAQNPRGLARSTWTACRAGWFMLHSTGKAHARRTEGRAPAQRPALTVGPAIEVGVRPHSSKPFCPQMRQAARFIGGALRQGGEAGITAANAGLPAWLILSARPCAAPF